MKLYFVRHGETEGNTLKIHQHDDTPLSPVGQKQARILARRFLRIPVDVIISSTLPRAKETAEIVKRVIQKEIVYTPLLREEKRPSEIIGKNHSDSEAVRIREMRLEYISDAGWHYSDEENYIDMVKRSKEFEEYMSTLKKENILVVTHGNFLKILIAVSVFGDSINGALLRSFIKGFHFDNTGITVCKKREDGAYQVLTLNDSAHLGELP